MLASKDSTAIASSHCTRHLDCRYCKATTPLPANLKSGTKSDIIVTSTKIGVLGVSSIHNEKHNYSLPPGVRTN